jgi:transcriptional regulator with XRE-family HTH domain
MEENTEEREGRILATIPIDTFAHRLMLARSHAGQRDIGRPYTIEQAAEKTGQSPQNWSNWERGTVPRDYPDRVPPIAEGLCIDEDWLFRGGPLTRPSRKPRVRLASFRSPIRPSVRRPRRVDGMRRRIAA